jgi:hypothetical protein
MTIEPMQELWCDSRRERDIDAIAAKLRGRTDLLFLALETRKVLRHGSGLDRIKAAKDRFIAIENAMDEETRYKLWQRMNEPGW